MSLSLALLAYARRHPVGARRRWCLPRRPNTALPQNASLHRASLAAPRAPRDGHRDPHTYRRLARGPARPPTRVLAVHGLGRLGGDAPIHDRECERRHCAAWAGVDLQERGTLDGAASGASEGGADGWVGNDIDCHGGGTVR